MIRNGIKKILQNYKGLSLPAKAGVWFTMSTVLQKGISFITVPIFTRIMTTDQYGLFSVYLSWVAVITILGGLEFHTCAYINGLAKYETEEEKNELAISLLNLSFFATMLLLCIYMVAREFWNKLFALPTSLVILMFIEVIFIPPVNLWATKQRYYYKYKTLVSLTIVQVMLNAILGIVFVINAETIDQALMRVTSITFVQFVFGGCLIAYFIIKAKKIIVTKYWKYSLALHIPLLPHSLSLNILASADRVMINSIVGVTEAAIYSVAYSASMVINLIKMSIVHALTPWIYERIKKQEFDVLRKNSNRIMMIVLGMACLFILFAPEIIRIVGTEEYYSAIYVIPPVAASVFFTFLYSLFSTVEFYYEKTKSIMYASIFAALMNIILNFIFIRAFGFVAAGYTTFACYLFLSAAHYRAMKKAVRENIGKVELFDMKFIFALVVIVLFSTILFSFLYSYPLIRYLIIAVIAGIIVLKRKKIISIFNVVKVK